MANKFTDSGKKMAKEIADTPGNKDNYIPAGNTDSLIETINRRSRRKGVEKVGQGTLAENLARDKKMLERQGY